MEITMWFVNGPNEGEWRMSARVFTQALFKKRIVPTERWWLSIPSPTGEIVVSVDPGNNDEGRFEAADGKMSSYPMAWVEIVTASTLERLEEFAPQIDARDRREIIRERLLKLYQELADQN